MQRQQLAKQTGNLKVPVFYVLQTCVHIERQ